MAALSTTHFGQEWLNNFDAADRAAASSLLDSLVLVSASEFILGITKQLTEIIRKAQDERYAVAFYAEREVSKVNHEVQTFFPNTQKGRATGSGIQPVVVDTNKQDIGSEGISYRKERRLVRCSPIS